MEFTPCPKIDTHLHLALDPQPLVDRMSRSSYAEMLPHMQRLGIVKGVLMSVSESASSLGYNEENIAICKADPEHFAWMCGLDYGSTDDVYQKLKSFKELGAVGIGELIINKPIGDPFLQEIFRCAGELEMPITFHMSPEEGFLYGIVDEPGLPMLEQALKDHPNTIFVGHSQCFWIEMSGDAPTDRDGRNWFGMGKVVPGGRVPELFAKYPNLYGDLSANSAGCAIMRDEEFGLAFLEKYADRLFFATDMVNVEMTFPLGGWLDEMARQGRLSMETYEKICWRNAHRIYGL